ncbi:Phage tail sheath protein [Sphingobium yanoikuyae]|uniref:Phage tail sheath protein n=1 Tax=Sphingobium yanoikuyae TaxID=13690 RepID=A0A084E1Z4_SPHYA|nr:phage tail sheath subtilisin-like domain-containing protein [Sphingobium yanoikuyae]KEZ11986.1 Phage tail sheath protein [Sphingobium yanoikuyae]
MPAQLSYPGVYVLEAESGARAIPAASTALTLFVGMVDQGPFEVPTQILGLPAYERLFGKASKGEMADQVRQYFVNGGGEAWIYRTALNAQRASVMLRDLAGAADVLKLVARDPGVSGNMIRAEVDYATASPERTFNLTLYRLVAKSDGSLTAVENENHADLSMDPASPRYAPAVLGAVSKLVTASDPSGSLANAPAISIGGTIYSATEATALDTIRSLIGGATINVQIGTNPPLPVSFPASPATTLLADIESAIEGAMGIAVAITATTPLFTGVGRVLQLQSDKGPIIISPHPASSAATHMGLGVASGGVEIDSYSIRRPVPTGVTSIPGAVTATPGFAWIDDIANLANQTRTQVGALTLNDPGAGATFNGAALAPGSNKLLADPATPATALGTLNAVRSALEELGASLSAATLGRWSVQRQGLRLAFKPRFGTSNAGLNARVNSSGAFKIGAAGNMFSITGDGVLSSNVPAYSLGRVGGASGGGTRQVAGAPDEGSDGVKPNLATYLNAFATIESVLPSFNIMVLPRADLQTDAERKQVWGYASASCAKRRAILLVDPDSTWTDISAASGGIDTYRIGIDTRNSAIFWPKLKVPQLGSVVPKTVDPSGSIAGLMARHDGRFGVWTAPAGLDATLRGVQGLDVVMSDEENGVINPKALNAIRQFPAGAVSWGARTMVGFNESGNIDDKYLPVRRTMLFIEESLYRGLKFATFKPNAEPLWASIRLAAGSFMNGLMRQGAFASTNKLEAYYVLCDETTTTPDDINLGIVNVIVGFAPLKPAEFVILTVKQIAQAQDV